MKFKRDSACGELRRGEAVRVGSKTDTYRRGVGILSYLICDGQDVYSHGFVGLWSLSVSSAGKSPHLDDWRRHA